MAAPHPARHLSAAHRPAGARLLPRAWLLPPRTALLPGGRAPNCRWSAPPRSPAPSRRRHLGAVAAEEVRCGPSEPRGHGGLRLWRLLKASAFSNVGPSAAPGPHLPVSLTGSSEPRAAGSWRRPQGRCVPPGVGYHRRKGIGKTRPGRAAFPSAGEEEP